MALLGQCRGVEGVVTTVEEADSWVGRTAIDRTGRKIGRITQVWIDDHSGEPAWATIDTGRIRRGEAIAPLTSVTAAGVHQQLACRRAELRSAWRRVFNRTATSSWTTSGGCSPITTWLALRTRSDKNPPVSCPPS